MTFSGCGREEADVFIQEEESEESDSEEQFNESSDEALLEITGEPEVSVLEETVIYVDVCGAVLNPGVYELDAGSRVFQAIEAAGGFLPEACVSLVNQAQTVSDEQQIYVPTEEEAKEGDLSGLSGVSADSKQSRDIAAKEDGIVNLNTADEQALMTLPGIGESKAEAILSYREENGVFSSIEDIMQVPGIKEGTFNKIKDKLAVK